MRSCRCSLLVLIGILCLGISAGANSSLQYNTDLIKRDGINDPAMKYFYVFNEFVINSLSNRPFPQETLIDQDFMNLDIVKSIKNNHYAWLLHEKWWLATSGVLIFGSLLFVLIYIFYKLCTCCCSRKKEEVDGRFDSFKRNFFNLIFVSFVILNIFASVAALLCSQYAALSVEKIPNVITWFADDLEMYKNHNSQLIDEIIEIDWEATKDELKSYLHNTGRSVVMNIYDKGSNGLIFQLNKIDMAVSELKTLNGLELEKLIEFIETQGIQNGLTVEQTHMVKKLQDTLSKLVEITQLKDLNATLETIAVRIQGRINKLIIDISQRIGDEDITIQEMQQRIKKELVSIDFKGVHEGANQVKKFFDDNKHYFNIAWGAFLGVAAILFFIALCFLFGVFYGMCGRRASYYNDDCCVRPTGGKFYVCGITLAVLILFLLALVASSLMLIFGNATDFICDPWKHPDDRIEMIDLMDRITYEKFINKQESSDALLEVLGKKTNIKQLIKGCKSQATFVQMLGIRDRYKDVSPFNDRIDEISKLGDGLRSVLAADTGLAVTLNVEQIEDVMEQLKSLSIVNLTEIKSNSQLQPFLPIIEKFDKALKKLTPFPTQESLSFAQNTLINHTKLLESMDAVIAETIGSIKEIINKYFDNLRDSLASQITSCEPIRHIMDNMQMALCDHTLDPLNGVWMSLVISLVLFIPLIIMASTLTRLYNHISPFTKYTVHEPHTEAAFTTDDYAMTINPNKPSYGARNYGYQDVCPPPYLNDQYRYRY